MRIARFSTGGDPAFGIVELAADGGKHPDTISTLTGDPISMPVQLSGERHELEAVRLLAPVIPRSKVVGVGRNYAAHAAELGNEVPVVPLLFFKPNTSVIGPDEPIIYPEPVHEMAYEGELAVVIGRICRDVPPERVDEVIFGYTVANDVTARDLQKTDGQWARAKGYDTFCPLGPWITTHQSVDEMGDVHDHHDRRRRAAPARLDVVDAARHHRAGGLHQLVHHPAARRRHPDRHPGRCR